VSVFVSVTVCVCVCVLLLLCVCVRARVCACVLRVRVGCACACLYEHFAPFADSQCVLPRGDRLLPSRGGTLEHGVPCVCCCSVCAVVPSVCCCSVCARHGRAHTLGRFGYSSAIGAS
jgi:hypothetical protein